MWLEIGFGGGEHLLARMRECPDVGFIGCEPFVNGMAKFLATVEREGGVKLVCVAELLTRKHVQAMIAP